jgi:hypothetical protein
MFRRASLWIGCGVLLAASLQASQASAQIGIGPGAYGLGFYNYNDYNGYYRVPYYALYPPVYYSHPVARPYGFSPFAYPPGTITPAVAPQVAAVEYVNPFVRQDGTSSISNDRDDAVAPSDAAGTEDKSASRPRMYLNPFVQTAQTASTK